MVRTAFEFSHSLLASYSYQVLYQWNHNMLNLCVEASTFKTEMQPNSPRPLLFPDLHLV